MAQRFITGMYLYLITNYMFYKNNIKKNGFTLVEILIVIAIMATLSVLFIISIKSTIHQNFNKDIYNLTNDFRYARNLAVSRTAYDGGEYPGKYGIQMINGNGTSVSGRYVLYAGDRYQNKIIKSVTFSDPRFRIGDFNASTTIAQNNWSANFEFIDENTVNTYNLNLSSGQQYQIFLQYPDVQDGVNGYVRAVILLGQKSGDDFVWGNIGNYGSFSAFQCRNGILEPGEECDDGNNIETDACRYCEIYNVRNPNDRPIEGGGGGIFE